MKKIRLVQKFGANTIFHRVGFVGGWWLVGCVFFFAHFDFRVDRRPELREVKPRSARNFCWILTKVTVYTLIYGPKFFTIFKIFVDIEG